MKHNEQLFDELARLLTKHGIGSGLMTPKPGGGSLTGGSLQDLRRALTAIESASTGLDTLEYGNGCFAAERYAAAAAVYQTVLGQRPDCLEAGFNIGLAYLALKQPQRAAAAFTAVLAQDALLPEAYYQRGNAYDDMGDGGLALADYSRPWSCSQTTFGRFITVASCWGGWDVTMRQ